jgi:hypothetical protein
MLLELFLIVMGDDCTFCSGTNPVTNSKPCFIAIQASDIDPEGHGITSLKKTTISVENYADGRNPGYQGHMCLYEPNKNIARSRRPHY